MTETVDVSDADLEAALAIELAPCERLDRIERMLRADARARLASGLIGGLTVVRSSVAAPHASPVLNGLSDEFARRAWSDYLATLPAGAPTRRHAA